MFKKTGRLAFPGGLLVKITFIDYFFSKDDPKFLVEVTVKVTDVIQQRTEPLGNDTENHIKLEPNSIFNLKRIGDDEWNIIPETIW